MDISDPHMTADRLFVCRQVAGELAIEQIGREVFLESGDITLLDPLMPYTGRFFLGFEVTRFENSTTPARGSHWQDAADDCPPH
jgi:hypothetical protein